MSWTLTGVRESIATALSTIAGLRATSYAPDAAPVGGAGAVAWVEPASPAIEYRRAQGQDIADLHFIVTVVVGSASSRAGQAALDAFLAGSGATSIPAAIAAIAAGSGVDYAFTVACRNYGMVPWGGQDYFGADLLVDVAASS